jgi:A/G-specific adenine glycosylase
MPYFERFVTKFPTVFDLANASEEDVLKIWQGLGYYSRARNLHHTAKKVAFEMNGVFPKNFEGLKKLKGVGDYTAAAIASICYNEAVPVVDGNVFRFLSRVFGIETPIDSTLGKKLFYGQALALISKKDPGTFNQAMMEFGATVCTPQLPSCAECVFSEQCVALRTSRVNLLPVKAKTTKVKPWYIDYAFIKTPKGYYLKKRPETGIWANMFEFPAIAAEKPATEKELTDFFEKLNLTPESYQFKSLPVKHLLTHRRIEAHFHTFEISDYEATEELILVEEPGGLSKYALPKLIAEFVEKSM